MPRSRLRLVAAIGFQLLILAAVPWRQVAAGLHGMQRRLRSLLEAEGVKSFESVGEAFDPARHEAVATVRDFDGAAGTVVDEAGRGYLWNDELLRPARVRVSE